MPLTGTVVGREDFSFKKQRRFVKKSLVVSPKITRLLNRMVVTFAFLYRVADVGFSDESFESTPV